jgi:hypothetical protein
VDKEAGQCGQGDAGPIRLNNLDILASELTQKLGLPYMIGLMKIKEKGQATIQSTHLFYYIGKSAFCLS